MKYIYRVIAVAGLALTLVPPILLYTGALAEERMKFAMFIGALIWFTGAIPWLGRRKKA
jgi:uncharacterized membrane protein